MKLFTLLLLLSIALLCVSGAVTQETNKEKAKKEGFDYDLYNWAPSQKPSKVCGDYLKKRPKQQAQFLLDIEPQKKPPQVVVVQPNPQPNNKAVAPGFIYELSYLILAVIIFRINTWAAAEIFPQFALSYPQLKSLLQHETMSHLLYYLNSRFTILVGGILLPFIIYYNQFSSRVTRSTRRIVSAIGFGSFLASFTDILANMASVHLSDDHLILLSDYIYYIEGAAFFLGAALSYYIPFVVQSVLSLAGSAYVFALYHFVEDDKWHTNYEASLTSSAAAQEIKALKEQLDQLPTLVKQLYDEAAKQATPMVNSLLEKIPRANGTATEINSVEAKNSTVEEHVVDDLN